MTVAVVMDVYLMIGIIIVRILAVLMQIEKDSTDIIYKEVKRS